jgi:hypothetical protein
VRPAAFFAKIQTLALEFGKFLFDITAIKD